jgi:general secretion pathway protein H
MRRGTGSRSAKSGCGGFTLIEIIVVLAILGVAAGIVVGFLPKRSGGLEVATAANQVAGILRMARGRAIAESRTIRIAAAADGHGVLVDGIDRRIMATAVLSMAGPPEIRFAADGSASGGGILVRVDNRLRGVRVDWLTGRVSTTDDVVVGDNLGGF